MRGLKLYAGLQKRLPRECHKKEVGMVRVTIRKSDSDSCMRTNQTGAKPEAVILKAQPRNDEPSQRLPE